MLVKDCQCECIWYGMAPHVHINVNKDKPESLIGSTRILPKKKWPDNFTPEPDTGGHQGIWRCPDFYKCNKPEKDDIE